MLLTQSTSLCFTPDPPHLSPTRFLLSLPAMATGHDIVQYLTHRYLLHSPRIPLIRALKHAIHHSTAASRGLSACYMSGPDFFLEIVLPYLVPLAAIGGGGADPYFHYLVAALGAIGGVYEHSGYDFALLISSPAHPHPTPSSRSSTKTSPPEEEEKHSIWSTLADTLLNNRAHGEHHSRTNVSFSDGFGSPGVCDSLFGTRWDLVPRRWGRDGGVEWALAEKEWRVQRERLVEGG
ncbi:sterol desaturase family protein [Aspergillus candidus]|uniref:Fatty acid hydroxylase domain-containing protein n=1 Tax=Aspergillus candidus TaxID=41067 RepID=A0A2I2FBI0_ASPCN|nr:hypothetical protein BDW47DRAFT_106182 [Aspergillus candidus]PLB37978.1 hypothetical protein BDW47DRAFT_106182 [Aspergillus candidus]